MARRGVYGHIVNLCCLEGLEVGGGAKGGGGFYAATKVAVRTMAEGLRQEVGT